MADPTLPDYDQKTEDNELKVKIICLGDSAVGKSKYSYIYIIRFMKF